MQYFTGRFQGRVPVLTEDEGDARIFDIFTEEVYADMIANLLTLVYGGRQWFTKETGNNLYCIIYKP